MITFPKPLQAGDLIAISAPSSGVQPGAINRLDLVLDHLRARGYRVIEGQCVRSQHKDASAPLAERAAEFNRFLHDPAVSAIFPPWGGELASELLEHINFDALRQQAPKWLLGYSDISTLQVPLTLLAGWATAHGPNLMDLAPTQTDALTTQALTLLESPLDTPITQAASTRYQTKWIDFAVRADAPLNLSETTAWKRLDGETAPLSFAGHLIGGCLDTLVGLAGTRYGDIPGFVTRHKAKGSILYLENVEMSPPALLRALLSLKRQHWFDGLAGLLLGRSAAPEPTSPDRLGYVDALKAVLGDRRYPVLYDVDIGHRPPQFTLINGAFARLQFADQRGSLTQAARA